MSNAREAGQTALSQKGFFFHSSSEERVKEHANTANDNSLNVQKPKGEFALLEIIQSSIVVFIRKRLGRLLLLGLFRRTQDFLVPLLSLDHFDFGICGEKAQISALTM